MRRHSILVVLFMINIAVLGLGAQGAPTAPAASRDPLWQKTGDQKRSHFFSAAGETLPYRTYVPSTWAGRASLPIILMLHGGGSNENTYMDQAGGLLPRLAEQHGYIIVSPLGYRPAWGVRQSAPPARCLRTTRCRRNTTRGSHPGTTT